MINTHQSKQKIAQVIVPLPVFEFLDYKIPVDASYAVGDYVKIPIGNRFEIGIITVIKNHSDFKKLKYITEKYNLIPLNHNILTFIQKVSAYTISPIGDVLKAVLRGFSSNNCEFHTDFIILGDITKKRISLQRQEIIDFLQQHSECQASLLRQQYSASIIRDMIKIGQLSVIKILILILIFQALVMNKKMHLPFLNKNIKIKILFLIFLTALRGRVRLNSIWK